MSTIPTRIRKFVHGYKIVKIKTTNRIIEKHSNRFSLFGWPYVVITTNMLHKTWGDKAIPQNLTSEPIICIFQDFNMKQRR